MPCMDPVGHGCDHGEAFDDLRRLGKFACRLFKAGHPVPPSLRDWWRLHQQEDARRLTLLQQRRSQTRARRKALAKLTVSERTLLGLKG